MKTRPITRSDLDDVQRMINGLAAHHGDTPVPLGAKARSDLVGDAPWFTVFVAEDADGRVIGYAATLPTGQLQFGARGLDVHHLFVEPESRGSGAGRALLQACLDHARQVGCAYVTVGTHLDNTGVHGFYEAQGFERRHSHAPRFTRRLQPPT